MKTYATILAGGIGLRFVNSAALNEQCDFPKQFARIGGRTLLELSIQKFEDLDEIDYIIVVMNSQYLDQTEEIVSAAGFEKVIAIVPGGESRFNSSHQGLLACQAHAKKYEFDLSDCIVLIHDAVRPFVSHDIIKSVCSNLSTSFDVVGVQPIVSFSQTLTKNVDGNWVTQNRDDYAIVQTPQGFRLDRILDAYALAKVNPNNRARLTDDISVLQEYHKSAKIGVVSGDTRNKKVTFKEDLNV